MVKWFCCSAFCTNNFRTRNPQGESVKFYRLPRNPKVQAAYKRILKTSGINWLSGHICCEHWSRGYRENASTDFPNIPVPASQLVALEKKIKEAKDRLNRKATKPAKRKLRKLERKFFLAKQLSPALIDGSRKRKAPTERDLSTAKRSRNLSKRELSTRLGASEEDKQRLTEQLTSTREMVKRLRTENLSLKIKIRNIEQTQQKIMKHDEELEIVIKRLQKEQLSYWNLIEKSNTFKYLCGLCIEQFDILWKCVQPYSDVIIYPDCKGTGERALDKQTELFAVLTICRHSLHQGVMAFMLKVSESTVHRIFVGWIVFLEVIFTCINLKPEAGFLLKKMPDIFIKTGHGLTDMIIDCTEFKFQHVSNLDLNSLMFSNYKNTITGKALIGIAPHGMGLYFSDIYPGSISDNSITEKSGVIQWIQPEHELMADRGFAVQDLCSSKGIYLNRPAQKMSDQFSQAEVASNFDIASTRIHVERFIGRVREWCILNSVWPVQRMDLLSSTWQALCHIVNLTMPPIGPK